MLHLLRAPRRCASRRPATNGLVRRGVALYGLLPFGDDPATHGLEPVLSWRSHVALAKTLAPGESTGYGRRFVAERAARIGLVPVGYGDGFRRGLTGTEILVGGPRRRIVGTISMDALAVELRDEPEGTQVTLIGNGVLVEEHARRLGTIKRRGGHLRHPLGARTGGEADRRWMSGLDRRLEEMCLTRWVEPCGTSCSGGPASTSTSRARRRRKPRRHMRALPGAP